MRQQSNIHSFHVAKIDQQRQLSYSSQKMARCSAAKAVGWGGGQIQSCRAGATLHLKSRSIKGLFHIELIHQFLILSCGDFHHG